MEQLRGCLEAQLAGRNTEPEFVPLVVITCLFRALEGADGVSARGRRSVVRGWLLKRRRWNSPGRLFRRVDFEISPDISQLRQFPISDRHRGRATSVAIS